jgi:hypothetical protein
MKNIQLHLLNVVQHLVTTARMKAYYKEEHDRIADLLDQADHLINLMKEADMEESKIIKILECILERFPELSKSTLLDIK